MFTTIDNNVRVFQVVTSTNKQAFCNLDQLNTVVSMLDTNEGYFTIYHFWNSKPKKVTKKYLSELFKASGLTQDFNY